MIKEYQGKTERVSLIISIVCALLIVAGSSGGMFGLLGEELCFLLVLNSGIFGVIALPVFLIKRFSRIRIYDTKIRLTYATRKITNINNGKSRLRDNRMEIYFSDIVSFEQKVFVSRSVIYGDGEIVYYEFKLKNGDMFKERFADLDKEQLAEIVSILRRNVNNEGVRDF
ncbi:MAG: hypothetical protein IKU25_08585 [Clostridia bacterium]|nr:hypothetical protein [Clostridia bacterium]